MKPWGSNHRPDGTGHQPAAIRPKSNLRNTGTEPWCGECVATERSSGGGSQIGQLDSCSKRVLRTPIKVLPILVNLKVW